MYIYANHLCLLMIISNDKLTDIFVILDYELPMYNYFYFWIIMKVYCIADIGISLGQKKKKENRVVDVFECS